MLISLYLVQYKYVKIFLIIFRTWVTENFCVSCIQNISLMYTIFKAPHDISDMITYLYFETFKEYLRDIKHARTDRKTEYTNLFQFC